MQRKYRSFLHVLFQTIQEVSCVSIHVEIHDTESIVCFYRLDTEIIIHFDFFFRSPRYKKRIRHFRYMSKINDTKSGTILKLSFVSECVVSNDRKNIRRFCTYRISRQTLKVSSKNDTCRCGRHFASSSMSRKAKKLATPTATNCRSDALSQRLGSHAAATELSLIVMNPLGLCTVPSAAICIVFRRIV